MPITRWWKTLKNVLVMKKKSIWRERRLYTDGSFLHTLMRSAHASVSPWAVYGSLFFLKELHKYKPCSPVWPTARPQPREIGLTRCYNCDAELHVLFFFQTKGMRVQREPESNWSSTAAVEAVNLTGQEYLSFTGPPVQTTNTTVVFTLSWPQETFFFFFWSQKMHTMCFLWDHITLY